VTEATLQQLELALVIVDRARIPGLTETARAGLSLLAEVRRLNGEVKRLEAGILPTDFEDTDPGKNGCRCDPDVDYYCDEHAFQREVLRANAAERECSRLQAELTALRARAVPAIEWHKSPTKRDIHNANVGRLLLTAWRGLDGGYGWCIAHGHGFEDNIADGDADSIDDAKSKCEAAFLRLVGAGNG